MTKRCIDCKWSEEGLVYMKCNNPKDNDVEYINKVKDIIETEELVGIKSKESPPTHEPRRKYCEVHRSVSIFWSYFTGTCGKQGRWFEPKEV